MAFNTFGYVWCGATGLLRQAAIVGHFQKRELKLSEAYIAVANCIVPIAGGMLMKRLFDAHPEWDKLEMINNNNNY